MIIYKITNLVNGKIYVGQDTHNNPSYLGSGKYIKSAIKKYGKKNFKKEILKYCNSKEELDRMETYYINELNSIKNGYNIAIGGGGGPHFKGHQHSEETKLKMKNRWEERKKLDNFVHNMTGFKHSEQTKKEFSIKRKGQLCGEKNGMYGKHHTEEAKKKISNPKFGKKNGMYGKHHTEETKKKMRDKALGKNNSFYGKTHNEKTKQKIREKAFQRSDSIVGKKIKINNIEFKSISEASRKLKLSYYHITKHYKECFI